MTAGGKDLMLCFTAPHEVWLDGERYDAGDHEIASPSKTLSQHAGSGHAAGVLEVTDGLDVSHVQSQEDGEAALAEAMGEHFVENLPDGTRRSYWTGPWAESHAAQDALEAEGALAAVTIVVDAE